MSGIRYSASLPVRAANCFAQESPKLMFHAFAVAHVEDGFEFVFPFLHLNWQFDTNKKSGKFVAFKGCQELSAVNLQFDSNLPSQKKHFSAVLFGASFLSVLGFPWLSCENRWLLKLGVA